MAGYKIMVRAANGYDLGDIVSTFPDDAGLGARDSMARWLAAGETARNWRPSNQAVLWVPSEPCDLNLAEPALELVTAADPEFIDEKETRLVHQRAWGLDWSLCPVWLQADLLEPGAEVTVSRPLFRSMVRHKVTGSSPPLDIRADGRIVERRPSTDDRARIERDAREAGRGGNAHGTGPRRRGGDGGGTGPRRRRRGGG